jgi:ferritin
MAVYFDGADLPQLAKHFYAQAIEERNHAMMLVQYLLDRDVRVEIPGVDGVRNQFDTPRDALALALDQERAVTEQVSGWRPSPATKVTTSASNSCSGSSRSRSKRWR